MIKPSSTAAPSPALRSYCLAADLLCLPPSLWPPMHRKGLSGQTLCQTPQAANFALHLPRPKPNKASPLRTSLQASTEKNAEWPASSTPLKLQGFDPARGASTSVQLIKSAIQRHFYTRKILTQFTAPLLGTMWRGDLEEDVFNSVVGDRPIKELGLNDVATIARVFDTVAPNAAERTFTGLKRGSDSRFSDDDLAEILQTATETPAGAFRGRGTPEVLRLVEIMGIEQSRTWGVCTMNEFRKFLGLKSEFETFEEWNADPEIATGLQAESTMPLTDGSRFACGYTITRGVLGDTIALVRGDRSYTSDFTPLNLTTWGFYDCQRDMNNGGQGGITHHPPSTPSLPTGVFAC
ncbi:hypothetical protein DXG01_004057 [Tephrocybe rancida]|nr:hypothetical protein DXG01_004057 [Tephrocybe rancida]